MLATVHAAVSLTLTLVLCKRASLRSILFCERANPRSEGATSRPINFCELTRYLKILFEGGPRELTI